MPKILVTGASGFVGGALCASLKERGHQVIAGVRSGDSPIPPATERLATGDLTAFPHLEGALRGVDAVVHLAARAHVMRDRSADPERAFREANVEATRHLAKQAAAADVRRLVFLSSIKVNGERTIEQPFTESDTPAPEDAYGRSKFEGELALQSVAAETGLELVIIRPPLVYGPGVRANFLRLLRLVDKGVPLPFARMGNKRSLLSVWNLNELVTVCISHPRAIGQTFLASDGEDLSTPDLIRAMARALRARARLFPVPAGMLRAAAGLLGQAAAVDRLTGSLQVSPEKAARLLDWRPCIGVAEGLERTAEWYRSEAAGS